LLGAPTHEGRYGVNGIIADMVLVNRTGNKTFEAVQSFQYLGNITSNTNNNNKCIKERIMMGNNAYYANRQLFNSSLIPRSSKLQIYHTLVLPVVTYGSKS
jgi:hypothetical protein